MMTAQHNMGGFMKGILVKRLESSFYAFRMTLSRFIESYERFIEMYKNTGGVWIIKGVNDLLRCTELWKNKPLFSANPRDILFDFSAVRES